MSCEDRIEHEGVYIYVSARCVIEVTITGSVSADSRRAQGQNGINGVARRGNVYAGFELELVGAERP